LRLQVSAGANVGERLMAIGARHYGNIRTAAQDWLAKVEIDLERIDDAPATFSGGMQQRLQIARNLVTGPRLVFMDEPTGGLDVSVQAQVLDLLDDVRVRFDLAMLFITHDLRVAAQICDRIMVMQNGVVVEQGATAEVYADPQHAYTQSLLAAAPGRDVAFARNTEEV
jgi:putative phosphonate transport system ATP-binding protein